MFDDRAEYALTKFRCEEEHMYFSRFFFRARQEISFRVNWHHQLIADNLERVINGEIRNLLINVSPGSSKTEMAIINFIARGLAINPWARFLHLSGSDSLASLNSATAREIVRSDEFQLFWPLQIADDAKAKKRWNVISGDKIAGGVYATSLGGQITGFRAGHMAPGFQGAILIDDGNKPEDAFSKVRLDASNRALITTVKSRRANPETPIIVIAQRVAKHDISGFILDGGLGEDFTHVKIPAVIDKAYLKTLDSKYINMIEESQAIGSRFSYWPYKEPIKQLLKMEKGEGNDGAGAKVSRFTFTSQYQQEPMELGGNIIKGEYFGTYKLDAIPRIQYRKIFADTAQKTKERNDFSVFEEVGLGEDGKLYLIDMIRGKWEAPELKKRAQAFWSHCNARDTNKYGNIRAMMVEDKSSGTDLIQTFRLPPYNIPIKGIERNKDKLTRVMDALPYIESKLFCIPEDAPFTKDFVSECESFSADDSHDFDDQIDPMLDSIVDMLSTGNKVKLWERLAT